MKIGYQLKTIPVVHRRMAMEGIYFQIHTPADFFAAGFPFHRLKSAVHANSVVMNFLPAVVLK